jgi:hypothetical protein
MEIKFGLTYPNPGKGMIKKRKTPSSNLSSGSTSSANFIPLASSSTILQLFGYYHMTVRFNNPGHNTLQCWLSLKDPQPKNKKDKIEQVQYRAFQPKRGYYQMGGGLSPHEYYYYQTNPASTPNENPNWIYNVSHLCHHWWCCNPEHLVREPEWVNILRKGCNPFDKGCKCPRVSHPDLSSAIQPCLWYTPGALKREELDEATQLLDTEFLNLDSQDRQKFKPKPYSVQGVISEMYINIRT